MCWEDAEDRLKYHPMPTTVSNKIPAADTRTRRELAGLVALAEPLPESDNASNANAKSVAC